MAALATRPALNVRALSKEKKLEEAIIRGVKLLPAGMRGELQNFLSPANLSIMVGTFLAWAIAHVYGVGEAVDVIVLLAGIGFVGVGFWGGVRNLIDFAVTAIQANSERDLDQAAFLFQRGVIALGVETVLALLMKKPLTSAWAGRGQITRLMDLRPGLLNAGPPPVGPTEVTIVRNLDRYTYGETDPYGNIQLNGKISEAERNAALWHEEVHAFFSPKAAVLRQFRAGLGGTAYARSVFLRYLEEAIAQTRSEIKSMSAPKGMRSAVVRGFKFPLNGNYRILATDENLAATIVSSDIKTQGLVLGTVVVEGHLMKVTLIREDGRNTRK